MTSLFIKFITFEEHWQNGKGLVQLTSSLRQHIEGRFVEQMLLLSLSFRCDQIYKCERNDFGHTLLCYLSQA